MTKGPLSGIRIVELAGIGPGPFAGMMLSDHGAEVIRVERPGGGLGGPDSPAETDVLLRGRTRVALDMKDAADCATLRDLIATADGLIEGFRPGVTERLGFGPDAMLALNPRLVYGRMTGWGQTGPLAHTAGHDINYIAISGVLHAFGRAGDAPVPPVNLVGDFGGGGMFLAFGMLAGLMHARATGQGQVVDAAMTEGSALLASMLHTFMAQGSWQDQRGVNILDTGAHFYEVYETADGKHMAIGAIEPKFYAALLDGIGARDDTDLAAQLDRAAWPALKQRVADIIRQKTRDDWTAIFEGTDACVSPVLSLREAADHPHAVARGSFVTADGLTMPAPAPRLSLTPARAAAPSNDVLSAADLRAMLDG